MQRLAPLTGMTVALLCFALGSITLAEPLPEDGQTYRLPHGCYEVAALNLSEGTSLAIEVESKHTLLSNSFPRREQRDRRGDSWADDGGFTYRDDVNIAITLKSNRSGASEEEAEAAGDAEDGEPLPELIVTTKEREGDPSAPSMSFQLDLPAKGERDVAGTVKEGAAAAAPNC